MEDQNGTWFNLDDVQYASYLKDQADDTTEDHPPWRREEYRKSAAVIERAIQTLEAHGMPRDRMRTLSNGIDTLTARKDRELRAAETRLHTERTKLAAVGREVERLRALVELQAKQRGEENGNAGGAVD